MRLFCLDSSSHAFKSYGKYDAADIIGEPINEVIDKSFKMVNLPVRLASLTSLPSTGHLSDGASSAVGCPHGRKPKGTFVRGPTPQIEPRHH